MMKKNSILAMLMVLVAALFGSSLVACSNLSDSSDTGSTPAADASNNESCIAATVVDGTKVKFLPVTGSNAPTEDSDGKFFINDYEVSLATADSAIDSSTFRDSENIKRSILEKDSFHNKYIIMRFEDNTNILFELEITDTDDVLLKATYSYLAAK